MHRGPLPLRPIIDGTVESHASDSGRFRVWYTLDGADALENGAGDVDPANGVPDAVDLVVAGLDRTWDVYVDDEGWRPPGDDMGVGGDSRLDVYLRHLDYNGYAHAEWHGDHWAAYLEVDPAVASMGGEVLSSVAGHELHHAIEYSYTVDPVTWVHEASATYCQYRLFHDSAAMTAAIQLLWGLRLDQPEIGLDATGDRIEYAAFVWVKFLVDYTGDRDVERRWWEILVDEPDWRGSIELLAAELGEEDGLALLEEYAEWLFFSCAADDGGHWAEDGMGCVLEIGARLAAEVEGLPAAWSLDPGPNHFGQVYTTVALEPSGPAVVSCEGPGDGDWSMRVVELASGAAVAWTSARPGAGPIASVEIADLEGIDQLLVLVANADAAEAAPFECEARAIEIEPPADEGCACRAAGRPRGGTGALVLLVLLGIGRWLGDRARRV